jgi:hypothetical protein
MRGRLTLQWVKAHQDSKKSWDDMTVHEKGNCLADKGTGSMHNLGLCEPLLPQCQKWSLYLGESLVSADIVKFMKDLIKVHSAQTYIQRVDNRFSVDLWKGVDWPLVKALQKSWDVEMRVKMVKLTWDLAATAAVLARRGHEDIDGFPICKLCNEGHSETSWHFMAECTCPDLVSIRRQTFQEIKSFLVASKLSEQEVALFGKIWAPAEEGFFVPDMIKSDDTFVNDHSAQRGWESKLSKSLCNALAMRRWGAVGLVHHAPGGMP